MCAWRSSYECHYWLWRWRPGSCLLKCTKWISRYVSSCNISLFISLVEEYIVNGVSYVDLIFNRNLIVNRKRQCNAKNWCITFIVVISLILLCNLIILSTKFSRFFNVQIIDSWLFSVLDKIEMHYQAAFSVLTAEFCDEILRVFIPSPRVQVVTHQASN